MKSQNELTTATVAKEMAECRDEKERLIVLHKAKTEWQEDSLQIGKDSEFTAPHDLNWREYELSIQNETEIPYKIDIALMMPNGEELTAGTDYKTAIMKQSDYYTFLRHLAKIEEIETITAERRNGGRSPSRTQYPIGWVRKNSLKFFRSIVKKQA